MAVASFLIWNARFMGRSFEKYVETGFIVGEDNDEVLKNGGDHFELAMGQNDVEDTSCAIDDEEENDDDEIKENVSDHQNEDGNSSDDGHGNVGHDYKHDTRDKLKGSEKIEMV
jgi:hypothetical protein